MFYELEALVAVAETGSMERAAQRLRLTPSALTRRIQRLESGLDTVLLDRHFKPLKLTPAGHEAVTRSRAILSSLTELRFSASGKTIPAGPFRFGLSHALSRPQIAGAIIELTRRFPLLQPTLCNDVSRHLLGRVEAGDLDAALVFLPLESAAAPDLEGTTLAHDAMRLVHARTALAKRRVKQGKLQRWSWVLNPPGCLVRDEIEHRVERLGAPLVLAAELHNPDLQLSLIAGDVGVGMVQASFLRTHRLRKRLSVVDHPQLRLPVRIAFYRGRYLGVRERAAIELERILGDLLATA